MVMGFPVLVVGLSESQHPGFGRGRLRNFGHGTQGGRQRTFVLNRFSGHAELHHCQRIAGNHDLFSAVSGEINNQIHSLAGSNLDFFQSQRRRQQPLVGSDLMKFLTVRKGQMEKSPVGRSQYAEAILARLHFQIRREFSIYQNRRAEEFRKPWRPWVAGNRVVELAIAVEGTIVEH
jgi:hypothetical protein